MNATAALTHLAADALALARSLGAPKVAAFGLSYGLEYAVSLTDLVSRSDGVELGGLASVVGGPWCRTDNPVCFGSGWLTGRRGGLFVQTKGERRCMILAHPM